MPFGVVDALALQGGVFLVLGLAMYAVADSQSFRGRRPWLLAGTISMGLTVASWLAAMWVAALT